MRALAHLCLASLLACGVRFSEKESSSDGVGGVTTTSGSGAAGGGGSSTTSAVGGRGGAGGSGGRASACMGPGYVADEASGRCYFVSPSETADWQQAVEACASQDMELASITSQAELDIIKAHVVGTDHWLGGNDLEAEGSYVWIDGSVWSFVTWATGEPDGEDEDCIALADGSKNFNDRSCANNRPYVCEGAR